MEKVIASANNMGFFASKKGSYCQPPERRRMFPNKSRFESSEKQKLKSPSDQHLLSLQSTSDRADGITRSSWNPWICQAQHPGPVGSAQLQRCAFVACETNKKGLETWIVHWSSRNFGICLWKIMGHFCWIHVLMWRISLFETRMKSIECVPSLIGKASNSGRSFCSSTVVSWLIQVIRNDSMKITIESIKVESFLCSSGIEKRPTLLKLWKTKMAPPPTTSFKMIWSSEDATMWMYGMWGVRKKNMAIYGLVHPKSTIYTSCFHIFVPFFKSGFALAMRRLLRSSNFLGAPTVNRSTAPGVSPEVPSGATARDLNRDSERFPERSVALQM